MSSLNWASTAIIESELFMVLYATTSCYLEVLTLCWYYLFNRVLLVGYSVVCFLFSCFMTCLYFVLFCFFLDFTLVVCHSFFSLVVLIEISLGIPFVSSCVLPPVWFFFVVPLPKTVYSFCWKLSDPHLCCALSFFFFLLLFLLSSFFLLLPF